MSNDEFYGKLKSIEDVQLAIEPVWSSRHEELLEEHKNWLKGIRRERPSKARHFKVAVYIRYYNQTKYDNYLEFHKKSFLDTLEL